MPRYWSVDEAWTAVESSPELDRELRQSLGDEVAIDFPSMRGPISADARRLRRDGGRSAARRPRHALGPSGLRRYQGAARRPAAPSVRALRRPWRHVAGDLRAVRGDGLRHRALSAHRDRAGRRRRWGPLLVQPGPSARPRDRTWKCASPCRDPARRLPGSALPRVGRGVRHRRGRRTGPGGRGLGHRAGVGAGGHRIETWRRASPPWRWACWR